MMKLGIAIGAAEIRAVVVRRQAIVWHGSEPFRGADTLGNAVSTLLGRLPKGRMRAVVSIAPAWVQVRRLRGLPPIKNQRLAAELIRQNQPALFLWKGPSVTTYTMNVGEDPWGAAFDRVVLDEVLRALRSRRIAMGAAAPAVVLLVGAFPNKRFVWSDAADRLLVEGKGKMLLHVSRSLDDADQPLTPSTALRKIGDDAPRYFDAYAASVAPRAVPLQWRPQPDAAHRRFWSRIRAAAAVVALTAMLSFVAFGPGVRAERYSRAAAVEIARHRETGVEIAKQEAELRRVTQLLNRIESFRAERGRVTKLLGNLSRAIPDSTALLTFHVDSAEGGFTAIAPSIADVLPALSDAEGVVAPRIVGSVTREVIGTVRVERASFRFVRRAPRPTVSQRRVQP